MEYLTVTHLWDIQILGTDINKNVIKVAQEGKYQGHRFNRHMKPEYFKKYFDCENGQYSVGNDLRKAVRFSFHNLIKQPYSMSEMIDVDIIFCRNVTIYFNTDTTKTVINKFYDILHDKGYLFLGHSETLWQICDKFKILDFPKGFVYQKNIFEEGKRKNKEVSHAIIPEFKLDHIAKVQESKKIDHKIKESSFSESSLKMFSKQLKEEEVVPPSSSLESIMALDIKYHEGVKSFESKDFDKALQYFEEIIVENNDYLIAHFAIATIHSSQGKYEKAMRSLNHLIKSDNLFLEAYFLKSVLHIKLEERDTAITSFKKVLYIDPDHALSYFHLGNLYKESYKVPQSRVAWKNLKRICKTHHKMDIVPLSDNMTYEILETIADKSIEAFNV